MPVRRACIDIGSNTTRLLVAECGRDQLDEVHQERAFTHTVSYLTALAALGRMLGMDLSAVPSLLRAALAEPAPVRAAQMLLGREPLHLFIELAGGNLCDLIGRKEYVACGEHVDRSDHDHGGAGVRLLAVTTTAMHFARCQIVSSTRPLRRPGGA